MNDDRAIVMLDRGADPNMADNRGRTPLHMMSIQPQILVEHGAALNTRERQGKSPLTFAFAYPQNSEAFDLHLDSLLNLGSALTIKDDDGKCAIDYAREHGFQNDLNWMTTELANRKDVEYLRNQLPLWPSELSDTPIELQQSFDNVLLAFGNANRSTVQAYLQYEHYPSQLEFIQSFHARTKEEIDVFKNVHQLILPAAKFSTAPPWFPLQDEKSLELWKRIFAFAGLPSTNRLALLQTMLQNLDGL